MDRQYQNDALSNASLEVERAKRARATLGVVVAGIKDPETAKKELGDDGLEEVQEQCLERIRANVRRVDMVTPIDKFTIAVVSVDRNSTGPRVLAEKIHKLLNGDRYSRMGQPVSVKFAVGATSGQPSDENNVEYFMDTAKTALEKARTQDQSFEFVL